MKAGIILCSRLGSSRLPDKAITPLNGTPLIKHLVARLLKTGLPVVLAVPPEDSAKFKWALGSAILDKINMLEAWPTDPLARMADAANWMGLDAAIRVCTDKVFVDIEEIPRFIDIFEKSQMHYLYSSAFTPGTGFEVICAKKLKEAAERFNDVEHISYAIRAITEDVTDVPVASVHRDLRLLIDYPADFDVLEKVIRAVGSEASAREALFWLSKRPELYSANRLPSVTVYTCARNAEQWICDAMNSVARQRGAGKVEYLLIDDASTDMTGELMKSFTYRNGNSYYHRLPENVGLSSACNFALSKARSELIVRLDADDYLIGDSSLLEMVNAMKMGTMDAIYPDHYVEENYIVKGSLAHHAGGAIFRTRALNHMKFTDGLRGYEGYDLYKRARDVLKIGYLPKPTFFYRQHDSSMSKEDPAERARIKEEIDARIK